jgi:hypothetical protein
MEKLGGWMTRFKRCIDAEAGVAVSKKVIIKTEQFDGTSNYAQGGYPLRASGPYIL